ncbi:MAG: transposase [Deltaproteobacteria bacterium]|nr:transposase [Deltaproteobacteria bacterium]
MSTEAPHGADNRQRPRSASLSELVSGDRANGAEPGMDGGSDVRRAGRWAYLAVVLDARQPDVGCIHHSDRGVQYAVRAYTERLVRRGFRISMSRIGNPYDNARALSFFKTLKVEEVYLKEYRSVGEMRREIGRFIDQVYNVERLHSALGYTSPEQFEQAIHTRTPSRAITINLSTVGGALHGLYCCLTHFVIHIGSPNSV